ncbi:hypothetical protein FOA52_008148 [Chlamydomonas sp. UWO 241]|nr:hypothetical protein FOA52_008148 [Chlamydomonas sp. UWO 241]
MAGFLGVAFGLGLGAVAGLSIGPQIFPRLFPPKDYSKLDEAADQDEDVDVPQGQAVTAEMRKLLEFAEPWTTEPDYQRVNMINRCIKTMWPGLSKAIMADVLKQVKVQLQAQVFKKFAFVENIVFGTDGMNAVAGPESFEKYCTGQGFNLGDVPPRIGGFKVFQTSDDEGLFEVPLIWGSNCKFNVGAFIRLGPLRLYIPVEVSNVHVKAEARVTLKPLVDVIPCIGGVSISLLRVPHVDLSLSLFGGVDLMALPIIKDAMRLGLKMAMEKLLVLPNAMTFPIMPNFGLPMPPKGALNVKLLGGEGLKGKELYCVMNTRPNRFRSSNIAKSYKGSADWHEEFNFIVDDPEVQTFNIALYEDVFGADNKIATGCLTLGAHDYSKLELAEGDEVVTTFVPAQFIRVPMEEHKLAIKLDKFIPEGALLALASGKISAATLKVGLNDVAAGLGDVTTGLQNAPNRSIAENLRMTGGASKPADVGTLYVKVRFIPFFQPTMDEEDDEVEKKKKKDATVVQLPTMRIASHNVTDKLKGVLTVHLIRCINLKGENPNSYVRILLSDEDADEAALSETVVSQNSPRYNQKFDFVMINAGSTLHLTVYNKSTLAGNVLNSINVFTRKKGVDRDKIMGKLHIPVADIARNGSIKDVWTLQDTERGQVEMVLSWQTCYYEDT